MGSKWIVLAGALPAALLCTAVSSAQEEPKPPAAQPAKTVAPAAEAATPPAAKAATRPAAKAPTPPAKRTLPARPGAGAPHTNVETTEGLEKRAAASSKPAAATASPAEPPK